MLSLPFSLSLLVLPILAQAQSSASVTSSITGSATGTAIGQPSGSVTGSISGSGSVSGSASSTTTAQLPTLSGYSVCVSTCLQLAISAANCSSVAAVDCYCGNTDFENSLTDCVLANGNSGCPGELQQAEGLASDFCALASTSTSLSFTVTSVPTSSSTSSSASGSSHSSSASHTSSSPSSSASETPDGAIGLRSSLSNGAIYGVAVAFMSALLGAHILL
ncbi:hypothetical protein CYLTODRAFT_450831 [Cylindrobasidium torrendii FP15055 ss-10]|uniref:CFEM domain-containing protein n=1 Tax=Cylindrobasidium torrendii FP15055 ss-10 TaxID=1314674 RepID=A0A0D7BLL7_9AGAR|nr:hypothetical protein CYLTODRAFT_450831 [Cylindrobasidium torrendii FP15055 ss-10]